MSITPGPNNVLFAASGARVGYVKSVPALVGMLLGMAAVIGTCLAGVGAVLAAEPRAQLALTVLASGYMLWLAAKLWRHAGSSARSTQQPTQSVITWWQMVVFQFANPKSWLLGLALVSGFLGTQVPGGYAVRIMGVSTFFAIAAMSSSIWIAFGAALRARMGEDDWLKIDRSLAICAAATVIVLWV